MGDFSALASCAELSAEQAEDAARSQEDLQALLARCAQIARPEDGCPKILMALARVASKPWLEADMRVELSGDEATTTLALVYDHGFGIRERMMPPVLLAAGFDEFQRAVRLAPKLVEPLEVREEEDGKLVLTQRTRVESASPPAIVIGETSINAAQTDTKPPPASGRQMESGVEKLPTLRRDEAAAAAGDEDVVPLDIDMREPLAVNGPTAYAPGANPHTRPTRRMNTIDPEILRAATAKRDPRRDED
ncbi:MAG TPA: hypothetical protein VIF62_22050 [Labilithrix sp.]